MKLNTQFKISGKSLCYQTSYKTSPVENVIFSLPSRFVFEDLGCFVFNFFPLAIKLSAKKRRDDADNSSIKYLLLFCLIISRSKRLF